MIKIEKGIEVPQVRQKAKWQDVFRKMQVGDSFVVAENRIASVRKSAQYGGVRITTRNIGGGKFRVWRIRKEYTRG